MRTALTLVVFFSLGSTGFSQSVSLSIGYASYDMSDLKKLNDEWGLSSDLPLSLTDDFPGFLNMEVAFTLPSNKKLLVGGFLGMTSTGSRLAYNDYSGHQYVDQRLFCLNVGPNSWIALNVSDQSSFYLGGKAGITYTGHVISSELIIYSNSSSEEVKFSSINAFIEPGAIYQVSIAKTPLRLNVQLGYNINIAKGKLTLKDDPNAYLTDDSGNAAYSNWSGVRVSTGISYTW